MEQKIIANQKISKDEIEYKQFLSKMGDMADSKKNMRIDFRPRVVMRTMRMELIIAFIGLSMTIMMPLYFIKLRPLQEKY